MELQGGDVPQHLAEKRAKPIFFFTFLPLNPFFTSSSPQKTLGSSMHPLFQEEGAGGGVTFRYPLGLLRASPDFSDNPVNYLFWEYWEKGGKYTNL